MMSGASLGHWLRQSWTALILSAFLIALVLLIHATGQSTYEDAAVDALVKMVVVIGLYIFIGTSGVVSFGHIAFMAIGAYATTWLTCCPPVKGSVMYGLPQFLAKTQVPNFPSALAAGLLAAIVALIIGAALMRLSGLSASIAMFAVLMIVYVGYSNWDSMTLGRSSIYGLPTYVNIWVALGWVIATLIVAHMFQISRWGLALVATREDEFAARASGINIFQVRLIAFVLSAFFVGVGGALYAHFLGGLSTNLFYLDMTFLTLAMLVVGGMNSLSGAVVGVVVISAVTDVLRRLEESGVEIGGLTFRMPAGSQELSLAVLMLLVLIFRQQGITGNREVAFPWPLPRGRRGES
jgi:branched-chain amino acid transport system permease protein